MPNFLLVFNRRTGERSDLREFDSYQDAMHARFAAERDHKQETDVEVVVLTARSERELRATHSRYFQADRELVKPT